MLEKQVQKILVKELKGVPEVVTEFGKIDILTKEKIIEIKEFKGYKSALGQILIYGSVYPNHKKYIYLFDVIDCECIEKIKQLYNKYDVQLKIFNYKEKKEKSKTKLCYNKNNNEIEVCKYLDFEIYVIKNNGYINATHLVNQISTKKFRKWKKTEDAREIIKEICETEGLKEKNLTILINTGLKKFHGTYIHRLCISSIISWACPKHSLKISKMFNEYINEKEKDDKLENLLKECKQIQQRIEKNTNDIKKQNQKTFKKINKNKKILTKIVNDHTVESKNKKYKLLKVVKDEEDEESETEEEDKDKEEKSKVGKHKKEKRIKKELSKKK